MGNMPPRAGASFKPVHFPAILETRPNLGFFEVHAENYMGGGGPPHAQLTKIREDYALSVHGVGLSIGGAAALDPDHLVRLKAVVDRYQPTLVSEHLAWSTHTSSYFNDLLAVPYTDETLATVVRHLDQVQDTLGQKILLENPSTYIAFEQSTWDEVDFIAEIARRSGCGLLLDVNNVHVSAVNHGFEDTDYIDRFPVHLVEEIHLAGHAEAEDAAGVRFLIDSHNGVAIDPVLALYAQVLVKTGPMPSLLEWDNDLPQWDALLRAVTRVQTAMDAATTNDGGRDVA